MFIIRVDYYQSGKVFDLLGWLEYSNLSAYTGERERAQRFETMTQALKAAADWVNNRKLYHLGITIEPA